MRPGVAQGVAVGDRVAVGRGVGTAVSVGTAEGGTAVEFCVRVRGATAVGSGTAVLQAIRPKTSNSNPIARLERFISFYQGYSRGGSDSNFLYAPCHKEALRVIVLI